MKIFNVDYRLHYKGACIGVRGCWGYFLKEQNKKMGKVDDVSPRAVGGSSGQCERTE